jgi:tetratricopeptide (TPR) repeat protein
MARSPRVQLQKAEKLVGKGKLDAALKIYEKVLQEEQNDSGTLNKAGDLYVRLNRIDKAIELFSRTAGFFIEEQFFVKAIAIYKKILRLDPTRLDIGKKLADTYLQQGMVNDAKSQYEEVADDYMGQGDVETALAVHHTMVGALPTDPSVRLHYAELLEKHDKLKESMSQYPQLAQVLLDEGGTEEAIKVLLRGVEVLPGSLQYIDQAARDLWESGAEEESNSFLLQAAEHNSEAQGIKPGAAWKQSGTTATSPSDENAEVVEPVDDDVIEIDDDVIEIVDLGKSVDLSAIVPSEDLAASSSDLVEGDDADDLVFELDLTDMEGEEPVNEEPPSKKLTPKRPRLDAESKLAEIIRSTSGIKQRKWKATPGAKAKAGKSSPDIPVRVLSDREKKVAELNNEADVLCRFGMDDKAAERLEMALREDPTHLRTYVRLIEIYLTLPRLSKVPSLANRLSVAAEEQENPQAFESTLEKITAAGFKFEDGLFVAPPTVEPIDEAEENLDLESALVLDLADEPTPEEMKDQATISEDSSGVTWLGEGGPPDEETTTAADAPALVEEAPNLAAEEVEAKPADDLIDIAEELKRELDDEDEQRQSEEEPEEKEDDRVVTSEEESLEDIVRGFREGVDATLSPEDYDTHFNLGIAYREMGLIDEAIGEFQLASKDPRYLIKGCSLLALSYLDKGLPGLAMTAYQQALESDTATDMESVGLRYEIGDLYLTMGDPEAAREYFVQIYGSDSNYRDVAQKLDEIERSLSGA